MNSARPFLHLFATLAVITYAILATGQGDMPLLINYQGELGSPTIGELVPDGVYDMTFVLYAGELDPRPLWRGDYTSRNGNPVEVRNGIFNVILGSGEGNALDSYIFNKGDVWLEISIERETLKPRQRITSTAYSMVSENSRYLGGKSATDFLTQSQADSRYWSLAGSAGTIPTTNFLGTIDDQPLELHVNGARALRVEPGETCNLIGGYQGNPVSDGVVGATVGGGGSPDIPFIGPNTVTDDYGTVGGGVDNQAGDHAGTTGDSVYATVSGGYSNDAMGRGSTVAGGDNNTASGHYATVGGGASNVASDFYATVSGGASNKASAEGTTVGGGTGNTVDDDYATVAGGSGNTADGVRATVGGGGWNRVDADYGTVSGGGPSNLPQLSSLNHVTDEYGTIGGGGSNQAGNNDGDRTDAAFATVSGGAGNEASGAYAAVGGGSLNEATGRNATTPGGFWNLASGNYSLAAGSRAVAVHSGTFVWADTRPWPLASSALNEFSARATGGVRFISGINAATGAPTAEVRLASGAGGWSSVSDRALKDNLAPTDGKRVLEQLMSVPISTWNYIAQDASIRHMGPMAQDFYAAFGLGEDNKHISTVDADGVALAAIQGLHEVVEKREDRISTLEKQNAKLETRLAVLEALVETLARERKGGEE